MSYKIPRVLRRFAGYEYHVDPLGGIRCTPTIEHRRLHAEHRRRRARTIAAEQMVRK